MGFGPVDVYQQRHNDKSGSRSPHTACLHANPLSFDLASDMFGISGCCHSKHERGCLSFDDVEDHVVSLGTPKRMHTDTVNISMAEEVAVFADTNLGTRIAFNAPEDITAAAFKRDFERLHFTCLPDTGEIQVNGLMVKRKSCFYYLPDSLPMKYAFPGMRRTWFLHVEVRHLKNLCSPCLPQAVTILSEPQDLMICNSEDKARCYSEEKRMEGFHRPANLLEEHGTANHIIKKQKKNGNFNENYVQNAPSGMPEGCSYVFEKKPTDTTIKSQFVMPENTVENLVELSANSMQGNLSEMSTEVISVTGIINKYFSGFNGIDNSSSTSHSDITSRAAHREIEVQSKTRVHSCSKIQIDSLPQFTPKTPPNVLPVKLHVDLVSKISGNKSRRSKVGKRLLVASRNLGVSANKHSPTVSFRRFKDGKLLEHKSQINGSIFAISDSDN